MPNPPFNPEEIDLLGHYVHPETLGDICGELVRRRNFHLKRDAERVAKGENSLLDLLGAMLHEQVECYHCGRSVGINWSGIDGEAPILGMVFLRPDEWEEVGRPKVVPDGTRCPVPELLPTTVRFTCKSGRIALGNDFRECHTDQRKEERRIRVNSHAGKDAYVKWYASRGYLTGFVGGTHVWFIPKDGGLDVVFPGSEESPIDDEARERLSKASVHEFSTELWWFAIVDAADLPEGATDSYDREVGYMDLPPGEYEVVIQPEVSLEPVVATIRPVEKYPKDPR